MQLIDEQFMEEPSWGARQMARHLRRQGYWINRKRVRRLMSKMGLMAIYQKPHTSRPHAFETGSEARKGIGKWFGRYNQERPHSSLDDRTPYEAYWNLIRPGCPIKLAA